MAIANNYIGTTLGRKYIVGITGVFWALFVMLHMLGNLLVFAGAEVYNKYSHALISNPFIYAIEFILVILISFHIILALSLKVRNLRANPTKYAVLPSKAKSATVSSRTMAYSGLALLGFIIWHIATFKYGPLYSVTYGGVEMRDLFKLVEGAFKQPMYLGLYALSMFLVGSHLIHGIKASFQTFGLLHPRYNSFIQKFGCTYAIVVALGFILPPLYFFVG